MLYRIHFKGFGALLAASCFFLLCQPAAAQVSYLNTFISGEGTAGGDLIFPTVIATGTGGQLLVGDSLNSIDKVYAADGSFQFTLVPNAATNFGPAHATYSVIGSDGQYYLAPQAAAFLDTFDSSGAGAAQATLADVNTRGSIAIAPTGTFFMTTATAATPTAPAAAQISVYSASGALLSRFGDGYLDVGKVRGLALSADASHVYVENKNAILQFTSSGTFLNSFGDTAGPGQLNSPTTISAAQTGLLYVTDAQAGIKVYSADGNYLRTVAETINGAAFFPAVASVGPTGFIYAGGSIAGNLHSVAARFFDPAAWAYGTNAFTNPSTGPTSVTVGAEGILGQNLTLLAPLGRPVMALNIGDTLAVSNGNLTVAGGGVAADTLLVDGTTGAANFSFTSGTLNAAHLVVTGGGVASISQPVAVAATSLRVADAASRFSVDQNAAVTVQTVENKGQIYIGTGASLIGYAAGAGEDGSGTFNLGGGTLDLRYAANLSSAGVVQGSGAISTSGGFGNAGTVKLSGPSSVRGTFTNLAGGRVEISGLEPTIFFDAVQNSGTFTIKSGAAAIFESTFSGNGAAAGLSVGGVAHFEEVAAVAALNVSGTAAVPTGTIDIAGRGLIVSGSVNGLATSGALASVRNLVIAGYHQGAKDGPGIFSSVAQDDARLAVGYGRASDLFGGRGGVVLGQTVNPGDIVVRTTLAGDANLDGVVGFADLVAVAQHYGQTISATTDAWWSSGDFNYDGVINFSDLVAVAQNYGGAFPFAPIAGAGAAFDTDAAAAFASVPEPSTLGLAAMTGLGLLFRRRRA